MTGFSARWRQRFFFDPKYLANPWEFCKKIFTTLYLSPNSTLGVVGVAGELHPRERAYLCVLSGIVISWKQIQLYNIICAIFHTQAAD